MRLEQPLNRLGEYPHASLDLSKEKKQITQLLKANGEGCGYVIRLTQTWDCQHAAAVKISGWKSRRKARASNENIIGKEQNIRAESPNE